MENCWRGVRFIVYATMKCHFKLFLSLVCRLACHQAGPDKVAELYIALIYRQSGKPYGLTARALAPLIAVRHHVPVSWGRSRCDSTFPRSRRCVFNFLVDYLSHPSGPFPATGQMISGALSYLRSLTLFLFYAVG